MPTLDANSLLSDPAPIWFDEPVPGLLPTAPLPDPLQAALAMIEAQGQRPALAVVPPPAADPLAQALPWLVRHLGVAAAVEAVVGPVDDDQPAASDAVLPALRRIGFDAHLQRRSLASIGKADLPTILLLHSGDACVLTARWQDEDGQDQCSLVLPGPQPDEFSTALAEIEAEYSGVALVVSRPARPPLASALARARAAQAGKAAGSPAALQAAEPAPMPHADALVALAAAVQGAQRAMRASRAEAACPDSGGVAAADRQPAEPTEPAEPLTLALAPAAWHRPPAQQATTSPLVMDDSPAAVLNLSFMQADKAVVTPGQALSRIAQDARALVQVTAAPLARTLVAAARVLARAGQRAAGQGAGLARSGWAGAQRLARLMARRIAQHIAQPMVRQLAQFAGQGARWRWRLLAFRLRQQGLAWHRRQRARQHHQLALVALGLASPAVYRQAQALEQAAEPEQALEQAQAQQQDQQDQQDQAAPWAGRLWPGAVVQTRLAGAAHWPTLGSAAQRLTGAVSRHPLAWLPGLAAASALCLLVGAPQAWAAMLSDSSRQALQATPKLLRQAFSANLDQAGQALLAQNVAPLAAARNRQDCELGQPTLGADAPGLAADGPSPAAALPRRHGRARRQADPAGQGAALSVAHPPLPAVRGRGVPRRARHACR